MATASIDHSILGKINGTEADGVSEYLGIQYATLAHRFAVPEVLGNPAGQKGIDATKIGPSVPHPAFGIDMEFGFLQQGLEKPEYQSSESNGLNLNVFAPKGTTENAHLPVLVWIHGGGFFIGSNSWPQWDLSRLVRLSSEASMPMVAVSINYRLGVPGFLTSTELEHAGIKANRGLRDQAAALTWIKQNIQGFGGDAEKVSVMGQSAGGASCTFQLHSRVPLFKRLIALGGNSLGLQPLPPGVPDMVYSAVTGNMGLSDLSPAERIEKLKTMPMTEIMQKIPPGLPIMPTVDGDVIPHALSFAALANSTFPQDHWCKDMLVGSCSLDGMIIGELALESRRGGIGKAFAESLARTLSAKPKAVVAILEAYAIKEEARNDDTDFISICKFGSDIAFAATSNTWARAWTQHGKAYLYYFNEPNNWPGKWQGHSTHVLDAAFLFQNFNDKLEEKQQRVAEKMAKDFIAFVNGKEINPDLVRGELPCVVYGESEDPGVHPETGRRTHIIRITHDNLASLDEIHGAWNAFVQGR